MNSVIRRYYGFQFFFSLLLWVPIFYEYQKQLGLSDVQIFGIQSIYYFAFCVLEIPTGILADRLSYRFCLIGGALILVFANLVPVFFFSYFAFIAHFIFVALARSLVSGASSAYLYEHLKEEGRTEIYKRHEGRAYSYALIGKIVVWSFVGAAMKWRLSLPYLLTAAASLTAFCFALSLPPLKSAKQSGSAQNRPKLREVTTLLISNPAVLLVMLQGVAIFVLARICQVNLFQPILSLKGFGISSYGWMMSLISIFEAAGARYPQTFRRLWSDRNAVFILTGILAFSLIAISFAAQPGTAIALCVFSGAVGLAFPVQRQLLNDVIPQSGYRATLLSMESIIDRAVCAWVAAQMAAFVSTGRTLVFLNISAGVTLVSVGMVWGLFKVFAFKRAPVPESL